MNIAMESANACTGLHGCHESGTGFPRGVCRLHINAYVSALAMIKEKVIKNIASELTSWFALWSDDRKYHCIAGKPCHLLDKPGMHIHMTDVVTQAGWSTQCMQLVQTILGRGARQTCASEYVVHAVTQTAEAMFTHSLYAHIAETRIRHAVQ